MEYFYYYNNDKIHGAIVHDKIDTFSFSLKYMRRLFFLDE